jgi:hypothetical protein
MTTDTIDLSLDAEADRLLAAGLLHGFETINGALLLGEIVDGTPRYLGEVEGLGDEVRMELAPTMGPLDGVHEVFVCKRVAPWPTPIEWCWLAWAEKVPAVVAGVPIPAGLRQRVAAAASLADSLIEQSAVLRRLTRGIDDEMMTLASDNGEDGRGSVLDPLVGALTTPLDQRLNLIARNLTPDAEFLVHPVDDPLDLDGTPR